MKLSSLFTNGAVLQRGMPVPVWGTTAPQSIVKVQIENTFAYAISSSSGEFTARLPEIKAGGPYKLTAENITNGEKVEIDDILVGEVWLASGQSNMEFKLKESPVQLREFLTENADPSTLRMITVPRSATTSSQKDFSADWQYSTDGNVRTFSAVALWFGCKLREKLGVPVGIIHSSWGGTFVEAWTSRSTLMRNPEVRETLLEAENMIASSDVWLKADVVTLDTSKDVFFEMYAKKDPGNKGVGKGWAEKEFDDSAWKPFTVPGNWIAQKIAGNGAVWARFAVDIPDRWCGKQLRLKLGGIDKTDITYFNGKEVGRCGEGLDDSHWNQLRDYTVPAELVKPGRAVIAVRAYSFIYDGAFNGLPEFFCLSPDGDEKDSIPLAGTWKAAAEIDFGKVEYPSSGTAAMQGPGNPNTYSILFDGMIRPLIPYAMRGAIWYQGETNAHSIPESVSYGRKMSDMITDWRFHWGQGDFPFYLVQLANFRSPLPYESSSTWGPLRESQRQACNNTPNAAMAVATDCGDSLDIHPKDKRTVGERLAAQALHNTYFMEDVVPCGPLAREVRKENGALRILFDHAADGLVFKGERTGFYLAGNDGEFKAADTVEIEDASLVVKSSEVAFPHRIRYNWADNPVGTLYNGAGFPAAPFEEK